MCFGGGFRGGGLGEPYGWLSLETKNCRHSRGGLTLFSAAPPYRRSGFTLSPAAESSISALSLRSRVSSRFALITQWPAVRR